jgi:hypothetical protein
MRSSRSWRSRTVTAAFAVMVAGTAAVAVATPAFAGGRSNYTCQSAAVTNFGKTVNAVSCAGTGDLSGLVHLDVLGPDPITTEVPYDCASGHYTAPYVYPPNITGLNCLAEK